MTAAQKMMMAAPAGGGAFAPTDISGLELWFDLQDASTRTVTAGKLVAWTDKSGNGNDFVISSGIDYGTTKGTMNGIDALERPTGGTLVAPISNIGDSCTVFLVCATHTNTGQLFDVRGPTDGIPLFDDAAEGGNNIRRRNDANALVSGTKATGWVFNTPSLKTFRFDGSTDMTNRVNGVSISTTSVSGTTTGLTRFKYLPGGNGAFADVIVYDTALSDADIASVETYLSDKWGITIA